MGHRLENLISSGLFPAVPNPASLAFKPWVHRLINFRDAECPATYSDQINIYVSSDGNDLQSGAAGLTPATAIQSLGTLNSYINTTGQTNKLRVNLRRGDVFTHLPGIIGISGINTNNLVITSYDDNGARATGYPPRVSAFANVSSARATNSGWVAGPSGTWQIGISATYQPVYWVKQDDSHLWSRTPNVLVEATGFADLYRITGSWMYSAGQLYVHFHNNANPSGAGITPQVTSSDLDNIYVTNSDYVRVEDVIVEGGGIGPADAGYGIKIRPSGAQSCVLKQVGSYYTGNHAIGVLDSTTTTSGHISTFINCYGGLMRPASNGETFFISYANKGAHQYIFYRNSGIFGTMRGSGSTTHTVRGSSVYAHSAGESDPPSFGIGYENMTILSGSQYSFPYANGSSFQDFPTIAAISGGSITAVSGFIIDEVWDFGDNDSSNGQYLNLGAIAAINPRWKFNMKSSTTPEIHSINSVQTHLQQYWINPRIEIRLWSGTSNFSNPSLFNTSQRGVNFNIDVYHGQLDFFVMSGAVATGVAGTTWDRSAGAYYTGLVGNSGFSPGYTLHNVRVYNTLMQTFYSGVPIRSTVNLPNKPPVSGVGGVGQYYVAFGGQSHNAYYGFPSGDVNTLTNGTGFFYGGYDRTTGYITLTGYIRTERVPHSGYTSLYNQAGPLPGSLTLEYDHRWHTRSNSVIGPFDNVRPQRPSGLRIFDSGLMGVGVLDRPLEKDVAITWTRKGDRTFTTTTLETRNTVPFSDSGFFDSGLRRQGRYLYSIVLTDSEGNIFSSGAYLNIGAVREPLIINNNRTTNEPRTIIRSFRPTGTSYPNIINQNIANDIVETDNSLYTYVQTSGGSIIDSKDYVYDLSPATGTYLLSGDAEVIRLTFKTPGGSSQA